MRAVPTAETGIPLQLTSFIGREREIAEIRQLLSGIRLLTVTGAGGSGKTRLALEVVRRLEMEGVAEVRWIELAPLERTDLVAQHVAAQLQLAEQPDRPILDSLVDALRPKKLLLVLDNCEHLVDAAAHLVHRLLTTCPGLTVLATSREALGVDGERAWLVPGLAVGDTAVDGDGGTPNDAVRLFVDRAQAASATFRLTPGNAAAVNRICRRLDGLPLAIELAAARVAVLPPEQIAARLDDAFRLLATGSRTALERHRTLHAAVDWSYRLLSPLEQRLFERLSVFAGSFSLAAAETICGDDDIPPDDLLDTLASLVARSLVVMNEHEGSARYSLLEIVRQYARNRFSQDPQALHEVSRRHAEHYAALAEAALPDLEWRHATDRADLHTEHDNLRSAMRWAFGEGDRGTGHRVVGALWWYWGLSGQWSEAQVWFREALERPPAKPDGAWAQVVHGAGTFAYIHGDVARGMALLEDAARLLHTAGDRLHETMALSTLAHLHCSTGDAEAALGFGRAATEIARTLDEPWPLVHALGNGVGFARMALGQYDAADAAYAEAFEAALRAGHHWGLAESARARAAIALEQQNLVRAAAHQRTAVASVRVIGDPFQSLRILCLSARILADSGRHSAAARLVGTIASLREAGALMLPNELPPHEATASAVRASLGEAAFSLEAAAGRDWTPDRALAFADLELAAVAGPDQAPPAAAVLQPGTATAAGGPTGDGTAGIPDLHVRSLGGLEVRVQGSPIPVESWTHAKPKELFAYLLCHPEGRTRDQIGLAFWPDASPAQVKNSFHVLLHKLRRILGGNDFIVNTGDRYRIRPDLVLWFDVVAFEEGVTAALRRPDAAVANRDQLEHALALYRGDFLEGEIVGDWHLEIHDRLRRLLADGLDVLADVQLGTGDLEGAARTLEALIRKEDLREDAYRRLMTCLARTGRRDQALRYYQRLVVLLREELDSEPEPATADLARQLVKGSAP